MKKINKKKGKLMRIKTVKVDVSRTRNLGDFNSCRISLELEAEVKKNETISKVAEDLYLAADLKVSEFLDAEMEKVNN